MKTKGLILKNGLLTLLLIVSLSLNCSASADADEIVGSSLEIKRHKTKRIAASLTASKEDIFTETLKDWMKSGLYWALIGVPEAKNTEIQDEMLQTKSADKPSILLEARTELFDALRNWMQNGFYWNKMDE